MMRKAGSILIVLLLLLSACATTEQPAGDTADPPANGTSENTDSNASEQPQPDDSGLWTDVLARKIAQSEPGPPSVAGPGLSWYQVFVYSFCDSDGDGTGDLRGVMQRLDYIQYMGFDGIWLSPIHPSSTYHKYNVRDYLDIDEEYGTLEDFDELLAACHARGIRVILDLVVNHTDLHHPWFTEHPEYYNISEERGNGNWERLPDGRWYECQFWGEMPDLNLDSEEVRAELEDMFRFWLDRGVDGFRLDAIKDYYSGDIAKNIEVLSWLKGTVEGIKPGAYLVGEVWDTTTNLYQYYESGVDSFFSFPFAGSDGTITKILLNQNSAVGDYLQKTADAYSAAIGYNPKATNAPFFTNHDMSRAAGFLRRDSALIKMAWGMSLTQPGDAFVYYGEELGMTGSGKDENKRAPMFWTDEDNAVGMTSGPPHMDEVLHSFPPAVQQVGDADSILSYVRDAVLLRGKYPQIGRGTYEIVPTSAGNRAGAVLRSWQGSDIIVVYNLSFEPVTLSMQGSLQDYLSSTGEIPEQQGDKLTLPGYCIAILVV